jgi:Cd2+/Zn2+-exporting ATPase
MDCSSCALGVERALGSLAGVESVGVDLVGERVTVSYQAERLDRGELAVAIRRLGYRVAEGEVAGRRGARGAQLSQHVAGACEVGGQVGNAAGSQPGIDVGTESASNAAGVADKLRAWWSGRGRLALAAVSGLFWLSSLALNHFVGPGPAVVALAIISMVAGGRYIVPRGIQAARHRALDMNFLMSIAALGALFIGEYVEAASAVFLFAVAQLLESFSMDRARHAVRSLMDLSPAEATVLRDGLEFRVPADSVEIGEVVVVRPGEKIPVDGVVVLGASSVDQAPITGESVPVEKGAGAEVYAGTLNGAGALEIRSTRAAEDTTLARIIHSVAEAQASRAPSQTFVDRFARIYTPVVVLVAAAVALFPPLLGFGAAGVWFYRALVLLVIACPCALVISTPVTIVSALTGAARRGILIKGGLHLENAGRARVVALDKTGTLTAGEPEVVDVVALNGSAPHEVLRLAAAAERRSEHPLARAILRHAEEVGVAAERGVVAAGAVGAGASGPGPEIAASSGSNGAATMVALTGLGVRAEVDGGLVYVGSERLFRELGALDAAASALIERYEAEGRTAVLVGVSGDGGAPAVRGVIAIADRLRPEAADALRGLHEAGIERVVMLTGDRPGAAAAVAEALGGPGHGIDEYRAGLLPEDKVAAVHALRDEYGKLLFVGDGVNDAPALAAADVGVAMGSAGTDVALETADIALMADDLSKLPVTIRFARKAERIIRANIAFSLVTKAAFVGLALAGHATLWMAVLADVGASLIVVANGMRALRDAPRAAR